MQRSSSLIGSGLLLSLVLVSVIIVALANSRPISPSISTTNSVTVKRVTTATNSTELFVRLLFTNGTATRVGNVSSGSITSKLAGGFYRFYNMTPGQYQLKLTGNPFVYLPPTNVHVLPGKNIVNATVYQLETFAIEITPGPEYNSSVPGPLIAVPNATVVRLIINNNTTLIQNVAVVSGLNSTESSSILFNSLSDTINAGGSVNDTFAVTKIGAFYYECLIGNDARGGEYGNLFVY